MKLKNYFNYKDWFSWVFWIWFIIFLIEFITNLNTLVRWKWGYWSIDLIPAVCLFIVLYIFNNEIRFLRLNRYVNELGDGEE